MTSYIVLRKTDSGGWDQIDTIVASNPTTAIRRADNGAENGEYAAVPARSWKQLSYQLVPVIKLAPAVPKRSALEILLAAGGKRVGEVLGPA